MHHSLEMEVSSWRFKGLKAPCCGWCCVVEQGQHPWPGGWVVVPVAAAGFILLVDLSFLSSRACGFEVLGARAGQHVDRHLTGDNGYSVVKQCGSTWSTRSMRLVSDFPGHPGACLRRRHRHTADTGQAQQVPLAQVYVLQQTLLHWTWAAASS
jgi:hypothetical protein